MTIGQQMQEPFDLWKSRHDSLLAYYQELRTLYHEKTGIDFIPAELLGSDSFSEGDIAFLQSLGIVLGHH